MPEKVYREGGSFQFKSRQLLDIIRSLEIVSYSLIVGEAEALPYVTETDPHFHPAKCYLPVLFHKSVHLKKYFSNSLFLAVEKIVPTNIERM